MDAMGQPEREEKVRPRLLVMQFYGGGVGIALLVNCFLIGHPIQYSYTADRDTIQVEEFARRRARSATRSAKRATRLPIERPRCCCSGL